MVEFQRLQTADIFPIFLDTQSCLKEQPGAGIPVVASQQQLMLRDIHHAGTRRVSRTMDDLHHEAAQVQLTFVDGIGSLALPCQKCILGHVQTLGQGLSQHHTTLDFSVENRPFRHILREHNGLVEPAGAQGMVMMVMGQQHGDRLIRQRLDKCRHIIRAVAGIHQKSGFFTFNQRHADAHCIPDVGDPRPHPVRFKAHALVSFAPFFVLFDSSSGIPVCQLRACCWNLCNFCTACIFRLCRNGSHVIIIKNHNGGDPHARRISLLAPLPDQGCPR